MMVLKCDFEGGFVARSTFPTTSTSTKTKMTRVSNTKWSLAR